MRRLAAGLFVAALVAVGLVVTAGSAGAASFTVTNTDPSAATTGSLPWAFAQATAANTDSTITVDASLAGQTVNLTDELFFNPASGHATLTLNGNGIVINQTGVGKRVIHTFTDLKVALDSVTLSGGNLSSPNVSGAAVFNEKSANSAPVHLALSNCTVANNTATASSSGSDILYAWNTTITNCLITNNVATGTGSGHSYGICDCSDTTFVNSTVTANTANATGTGNSYGVCDCGDTTITNSGFSNNTVSANSGSAYGILDSGDTTISGSTFTGNTNTSNTGSAYGICDCSDTTITDSTFTGNTNSTGSGDAYGILDTSDTTITNSTFSGNTNSTGDGQAYGICDCSDTTVTNSTFSGNTNSTGSGNAYAIFDTGDTTLTNATIVSNTNSTSSGGDAFGIVYPASTNAITTSTIANNKSTSGSGDATGAVYVPGSDVLEVTNSTISGNVASGATSHGGAIDKEGVGIDSVESQSPDDPGDERHQSIVTKDNGATKSNGVGASAVVPSPLVTIRYSTIVDNTAAVGANLDLPSVTIFGTVVALPHGGQNCKAGMTTISLGSNFSDDASCGFTGTGDTQNGGDPKLAVLGDYSGPTPTRPPLLGSPLINAADCAATGANGITVDQRGVTRPQGSGCDIGAVEVRTSSLVVSKVVDGGTSDPKGPFTFVVACNDGTSTQVSVPAGSGGTSAAVTGIKFGATCTVVESAFGSPSPQSTTYDPVGVDGSGMFIDQDAHEFTVTVTNTYAPILPAFTG